MPPFALFLLALASVPGSLLPQRGVDPVKVTQYLADEPTKGRILDRLGMFDVFASPWFAAMYLLNFSLNNLSLIFWLINSMLSIWSLVMTFILVKRDEVILIYYVNKDACTAFRLKSQNLIT